mmetsp:Transcript_4295/g.8691  ORF Transcript_4295/g.8691 Transcript_4295/m.8691 type:complete len:297 (+) Transcript_4295:211-1101(+)
MEELLPARLLLHGVFLLLVAPLLLLDGQNLAFLRLDDLLGVGLLDHQALRDLVARRRGDLLDVPLLLRHLADGAAEPDLVELHLALGAVLGERHLVAGLRLLGDDAVVPQAVLGEDGLDLRAGLALRGVRGPQHLHVGDLVLALLGEADEVDRAALDAPLVAADGLDLAVVPLLLVERLARPANQGHVDRLALRPLGTRLRRDGHGLGLRGLVLDQVLREHDDLREVILELHERRLVRLLLEGLLHLRKLLAVRVELGEQLLGRLREVRHGGLGGGSRRFGGRPGALSVAELARAP